VIRTAGYAPGVAAALAATLLLGSCGGSGVATRDLMPADNVVGDWRRDGDRLVFRGAELYGHINGGAEVFLELGFDRLEVQRFSSELGELVVELYQMNDPVAALGIYLAKCGTEHSDPGLADRHTVGPTQLQMVRGAVYLSVNSFAAGRDLGVELVDVARYLAERLPAAEADWVFEPLPKEHRVPGSERVIRGRYTFEALYTLGEGDVLGLADGGLTAVAAQYRDAAAEPHSLVLVPYPDAASAEHALESLLTSLDPYLEVMYSEPDRLVFSDYAGRFGEVARDGAALRIRVHLTEAPGDH
jgi:hypothetical protein